MRASLHSEGHRPRAFALILLTILVASCGGPTTPAAPTGGAFTPTPSLIVTTPVPGTPPPSAASGPFEPGGRVALVARQRTFDTWPSPSAWAGTVVLEDGRVIWGGSGELRARSLTALGLDYARRQFAIPVLAQSGTYVPTPLGAVASPPGFSPQFHFFQIERAGDRIAVVGPDAMTFAVGAPGIYVIPNEAIQLSALAERVTDPPTWLRRDEWDGPSGRYNAERYLVIVSQLPPPGELTTGPDADTVAWPFGPIESAGAAYRTTANGPVATDSRCMVLSRADAKEMVAAELDAGAPMRDLDDFMTGYTYAWRRGGVNLEVETRALLPYQSSDCSDAMAW